MIKIFTRILHKRAIKFTKENLKRIEFGDMAMCHGYRNRRCYWNSYTEYRLNPDTTKVIATVCITHNDSDAMIHFINYNTEEKHYFDITLGASNILYYCQYIIGECELSSEYVENMGVKLGELKYWLIDRSFKNKYVRKFYKWLEDRYCII